jgi:mono/diheme cytochrome c family protein
MNNSSLRLVALASVLVFAGGALQAEDIAGSATKGKELYVTFSCYACHGFSGQNGQGARLVPMKIAQAGFIAYVRSPRQMPPYSTKVMTDAQLADVYAYIKTLPDSRPAKSIPLLNQIKEQ